MLSCTHEAQMKLSARQDVTEKPQAVCSMVGDTVDFGCGISEYDPDKMCLDSMITLERFEDPDIRIRKLELTDPKKFQWNSCTIDLNNDQVTVRRNSAVKRLMKGQCWRFESCSEIVLGNQMYVAAFLFPDIVCSHHIEYPIVLIDGRTKEVRFLNEKMNLTPSPKCFCDIDQDGKLDFLHLNYYKNKVDFYDLASWSPKPEASVKMRHLSDMVYVIDQSEKQ